MIKKLFFLLIFSTHAFAGTIYVPIIDFYSNPLKPGFFNSFIDELKIEGHEIKFLPFKRAVATYLSSIGDVCFTGGDESISKLYVANYKREDYLYSKEYMRVPSKIFSLEKVYCKPSDIEGLSVLRTQTFPIQEFISPKKLKSIYDIESFESGIKMLKSNRGDVIVTYLPSNTNLIQDLKYCHDKNILTHFDTIQCKNTSANKKFIAKINKKIDKMKQKKMIKKLMQKHFPKNATEFYLDN